MGRYSANLNTFAKTSVENEVCPFCNHPLPVGVTECKCGAYLARGGPNMQLKLRQRKSIVLTSIICIIAISCLMGNPRVYWWAWLVPAGFMVYCYMVWPKIGKAWFRNDEIGYRQIWIDE